MVGRFGEQLGKLGPRRVRGLGGAEAEVASVGPASACTEMTALFESLIK